MCGSPGSTNAVTQKRVEAISDGLKAIQDLQKKLESFGDPTKKEPGESNGEYLKRVDRTLGLPELIRHDTHRIVARRSVRVLQARDDCWAFRHSLISEALHQDLLPGEHTAVHHRFAAALRRDPSLVPAGCAAIAEAEHWQHAHDPAGALSSAWRAAAEAGRGLAGAEQLAMLTRVLELWQSVPDAEWLTGAAHALVLRQAADVATAAGERQLGTALASAAQAEAGGYADPGQAARLLRR